MTQMEIGQNEEVSKFWNNMTVMNMEEIMTNQQILDLERCQTVLRNEGISTWQEFWQRYQEANIGPHNRFKDLLGYKIIQRTSGGFSYYRSTNSYLDNQVRNWFIENSYDSRTDRLPMDLRDLLQGNRAHSSPFVKWLRNRHV